MIERSRSVSSVSRAHHAGRRRRIRFPVRWRPLSSMSAFPNPPAVSNSHGRSCGGWESNPVATMGDPPHPIQISRSHRASTGERQWRVAVQGRVAAGFVVVGLEVSELSFQITAIPEQHVV
jgi:hypothetical protein